MSISFGNTYNALWNYQVERLAATGASVVVAAGNSGGSFDACQLSPQSAPETTV